MSNLKQQLNGRVGKYVAEQLFNHLITKKPGHCVQVIDVGADVMEESCKYLNKELNNGLLEVYVLTPINKENIEPWEIHATKLVERRNAEEKIVAVFIPHDLKTAAEDSFDIATFEVISFQHIYKDLSLELEQEILENQMLNEQRKQIDLFKKIRSIWKVPNDYDWCQYYLGILNEGNNIQSFGTNLPYLYLIPDKNILNMNYQTRITENVQIMQGLRIVSKSLQTRINSIHTSRLDIKQKLLTLMRQYSTKLIFDDWIKETLVQPQLLDQLDFSDWELEELSQDIKTFKIKEIKGNALVKGKNEQEIALGNGGVSVKYEVIPSPPDCSSWEKLAVHIVEGDSTKDDYKIIELLTVGRKPTTNKALQSKALTEKQLLKLENNQLSTFKIGIQALSEEGIPLETAISEQLFYIAQAENDDDEFVISQKEKIIPSSSDIWIEDLIEQSMKSEAFQFEATNYVPVIEEHASPQDFIKISSQVSNKTYAVSTNILLSNLHKLVLNRPEYIGNIRVSSIEIESFEATNSFYTDRPLEQPILIDGYEAFINARKHFFQSILNLGEYHWDQVVSIIDRTNIRRLVKIYIDCYETLMNNLLNETSEQALDLVNRLRLIDTIAISDSYYQTIYLMTPTHPLKLAWQFNFEENSKNWIREASLVMEKDKQLKQIRQILDQQSSINYPFLIKDKFNKWYGNMQIIGRNWGVYVEVKHLSDEYYHSYVHQLLKIEKQSKVAGKMPVAKLKNYILQYLDKHSYISGLSINLIEPGDGEEIVQMLKQLYQTFNEQEKYNHFKDLRIYLKMFTKDPMQLNIIGEKINQLMQIEELVKPNSFQEKILLSSGNQLFPFFIYSKHLLSDLIENPSNFQSHITIMYQLLDVQFGVVEDNFAKRIRSSYMNGLNYELTTKTSGNSSVEEYSTWSKFISTRFDLSSIKEKKLSSLMDSFNRVSMFSERGQEQGLPAIVMTIKPEQKKELEVIHSNCDWVLLLDEYLGPDFLDRPASGRERYHLIDFVPNETLSDNNVFVSTNRIQEIETMVVPALKGLGIDIKKDAARGIVDSLNAISGRLVLKLNSVENQLKGAIGMALARLYIGELNRISKKGQIIILPLDAHADWFKNMDSHKMTDLLAIMCDTESRTITFNLIEVKWRSKLRNNNIMDEDELRENIKKQLENSQKMLEQKFIPNEYNSALKFYQAKDLSKLLKYYLNRSERFKSISSEHYLNLIQFISRLDDEQGYDITFANHALIFVNNDQPNSSRVIEDVTYHTIGKSYIEKLINGATVEFSNETQIFSDDHLLNRATYFFKKSKKEINLKESPALIVPDEEERLDEYNETVNNTDDVIEEFDEFDEIDDFETFSEMEEEFKAGVDNSIVQENSQIDTKLNTQIVKTEDKNAVKLEHDLSEQLDKSSMDDPPIFIGSTNGSSQYGILGELVTNSMKVGLDLNETSTISLFGVQGSGKSYSIGTIVEMAVKQFKNANKLASPLASVIFHYSKSETYKPEFTTFNEPNNRQEEIYYLERNFNISPDSIDDVVLLVPAEKLKLRKRQYPSIDVKPLLFKTNELSVEDWNFLMGTANLSALYMKQLKQIIRMNRHNLTLDNIRRSIEQEDMEERSRKLLLQRIQFVEEYVDDSLEISTILKPGRIIIVDIRDEFIEEDEALGLFMVLLRIFSDVQYDGKEFNKLIVFDEAHKFMKDDNLMGNVIEVIREMRHKGVSVMIASQNPPSVPKEIIELSNIVILHKFNAPAWLKHIQKSLTATDHIEPTDLINLNSGEAYVWASKSNMKIFEKAPQKLKLRPRITLHGGATKNALD